MSLIIENVDNFKHILRILNTNIEGVRTVPYAIEAIKGVGRRFGYLICKILRINPRMRAGIEPLMQVNSPSSRPSKSLTSLPIPRDAAFPVGSSTDSATTRRERTSRWHPTFWKPSCVRTSSA